MQLAIRFADPRPGPAGVRISSFVPAACGGTPSVAINHQGVPTDGLQRRGNMKHVWISVPIMGVFLAVLSGSPKTAGAVDSDTPASEGIVTRTDDLCDYVETGTLAATDSLTEPQASIAPTIAEPELLPTQASNRVLACQAACSIAVFLGCTAVYQTCIGTTVITLGGVTIPCFWAATAACAAAQGGLVICQNRYCPSLGT